MSCGGFEIDMLSVGKADCILLTKWDALRKQPLRVLIDGGKRGSVDRVRSFLVRRGATYIDHVVCSHPHGDHAGGLVELVKDEDLRFGKAWLHMPKLHVDMNDVDRALSKFPSLKRARVIEKSLRTADALLTALRRRGVPVEEPFENKRIAFLKVCGPSEGYYEELLGRFTDPKGVLVDAVVHAVAGALDGSRALDPAPPALEEDPVTTPENDGSVILRAVEGGGIYLFASDAGVPALERARSRHHLQGCRWMQIPHHGSRRNITADLIEHFRPTTAFVSADGSKKHPNPAVVSAFKEVGTQVYGTHYPDPGSLWQRTGRAPSRPEYEPAIPL